jgi:hypothetical protein
MNFNTPWTGNCTPAHDLPRGLAHLASAVGLAIAGLSLSFAAHAQSGTKTIDGIFTNAQSAPDWTISGSRYGSPRIPTMDGSGWLLLASATDAVLGQVEANAKFASGAPIRVEFDYLIWGGTFDGLTLYFADANAASAGKNAEVGGGLGYCGMSGAFLGIGIDDGGNFAQQYCGLGRFSTPGPLQGTAATGPGVRGNSVTVRGPEADKYPHVTSVLMNDAQDICVTCTDRDQAMKALRHVEVNMVPRAPAGSGYTLNMKVNGREILQNVDYPYAPPKELLMGLASTTGSFGANHEIRNLKLSVEGEVKAANCLNGVGPDGKCAPVRNAAEDWNFWAEVAGIGGRLAPKEVYDSNLAQAGWDGTADWSKQNPTMAAGECMRMGPVSNSHTGTPANQIVLVSRQDDWQHAVAPTLDTTFTKHGIVNFQVAYVLMDNQRVNLPPVEGNDKVIRVFDLPKTEILQSVDVTICKTADNGTSPLTELLVWDKK